jgi:hypothetical protein
MSPSDDVIENMPLVWTEFSRCRADLLGCLLPPGGLGPMV